MKIVITFFIICLLLAACIKSTTTPPVPTITQTTVIRETLPFTQTTAPSPSPTHPPTPPVSTPTETPTIQPNLLPAPEVHELPGPLYDTVIQIPVGEGGILYQGAGVPDMEPVGPNGIVVMPNGTFVIGDVNGNRLMRYDANGKRLEDIDLTALDILNISDMVSIGDSIYILEISFKVLPERYRVNQLTSDGKLVSQYDLPEGLHFEDGLFGLAIGYPANTDPQLLIQLGNADNSQFYLLPGSAGSIPEKLATFPVFGEELQMQSAAQGELAVTKMGTHGYKSQMTAGGTIFLLSARQDGSLYLQRDDLVAWDPITTDITIHYVRTDGEQAGVARYPLMDWYFHVWRFLTVGPDGNVYGLITREKSVDILRLNFYPRLEPILPGVAEPAITSIEYEPASEPDYDCSKVSRIPPDSPESRQIVDSFITNYLQDFPTEYMAFEQLWSLDRLGEFAVLQGMVTQEESDIIVVQETERGFVMVTRYIGNMPIPGYSPSELPRYLSDQVPEAPRELFYCLDLSRFLESN